MRFFLLSFPLLVIAFHPGCAPSANQVASRQVLNANGLKVLGRYLINSRQELELVGSAAHFSFSFQGSTCQLFASAARAGMHTYLQYDVDGVYGRRVRLSGSEADTVNITAARGGSHTVRVFKTTEAHTGALVIYKVVGSRIVPLDPPQAPLIEFIGNSITAGAAADPSQVPCETGEYHDQHNAYQAYGPRVARALGANFTMSSVSGIGIYRTWNKNGPSMPQVYGHTDFREEGPSWNFPVQPQVVSIALGTNDFSDGDGKSERSAFDSTTFVDAYTSFVKGLYAKYPAAKFALLSSPMVSGARDKLLRGCLMAVKASVDSMHTSRRPIALFFFAPMTPRGCGGHPSVEDHAVLAQQVVGFYRSLLK
jgi:hypothetical protein